MSWGSKISIVFIGFAGMISYMVYRCMLLPVDLVSNQYYKDELAYQQVIDGTRRANGLSGRLQLDPEGGGILLRMPVEMRGRAVSGTVVFYCPSDAARDRRLPLAPDHLGEQAIAAGSVLPGHYTVKVSWKAGGLDYYTEQPMELQPR